MKGSISRNSRGRPRSVPAADDSRYGCSAAVCVTAAGEGNC
jgi:hypothetical protein